MTYASVIFQITVQTKENKVHNGSVKYNLLLRRQNFDSNSSLDTLTFVILISVEWRFNRFFLNNGLSTKQREKT